MKKYSIIITFLAFSLAPRTLTSTGGPFRDSLCIIWYVQLAVRSFEYDLQV